MAMAAMPSLGARRLGLAWTGLAWAVLGRAGLA